MKRMMNYLVLVVLFALQATACNGSDKVVNESDLPVAAQSLLKTHFQGKKISLVQKDKDGMRMYFDVVLSDGTKLEFDSEGKWTEIDTKPQPVPAQLIPEAIKAYVNSNYPDVRIVLIDRDRRGYEVDLSNGLDLRFNKNFKMVEIDD